jgi:hypothetical protein
MNHLTKVLLEDLLGDGKKKITAIYGGGFKPPTKGHFDVVAKAAEQNPEIDDFIIYVGGGERNGVAQGESIQIWELYKKYLPMKVRIEPSKAPVGDVLRYAKEHPEEEVLWIIGARENNPEDFADISSRTRTLDKYPNLQLRVIQTSGGVSGTAARNAVKNNNKEQFFYLIPDIAEKQQVWDIVSPIIKEVGEANLKPYKWEEVDMNGWVTFIEFTTESGTEYKVDLATVPYFDNDLNNLKALEVEFSAKPKGAERSSAKIVVNKGELYKVMSTITAIIKHYIKKFKAKAVMYSPSKKSDDEDFGTQRDNLYKAFINKAIPGIKFEKEESSIVAIIPDTINELVTDTEVICDNCGWEWPIADGGDDLYICHKCGHDNNPDLEEASDPQAGTALPYGSGFAPVKENDPFGLNEIARQFVNETLKETWKPEESFVSLSKYMIDNGMNIKPLPKIKVISDDKDNASNLLGKTAYYNPTDKSITLYTMDRHPKDILRSFSHEMVHHEQNLEGKLNNINTTNTNEDGALPEIEREAYEKGNMMLRNWEDSLKNV